jgi:hypothetical protein
MPAIAVEFPAGNITKAEGCLKCSELLTVKALFTVVDATVFDSSGRCTDGTSRHEQIKITRKSALTLISFIITS